LAKNPLTGEIKLIQACRQMAGKKTFDREYRGLLHAMEELTAAFDEYEKRVTTR
jgi:uncharacterized protein